MTEALVKWKEIEHRDGIERAYRGPPAVQTEGCVGCLRDFFAFLSIWPHFFISFAPFDTRYHYDDRANDNKGSTSL